MGASNCCREDQKLGGGFSSSTTGWNGVEMVPWKNDSIENNFTQQKTQLPANNFGRRVHQLPRLHPAVKSSRARAFQNQALGSPAQPGVALPPYYLHRYRGYYDGEWNGGVPTGTGKLYFENGSYFEGPFSNGEILGQDGVYFYPDGSYKRGFVRNGKLQGPGQFVSADGRFTYQGNWANDQPNGKGVERYPDGSVYEGNFVNGVKSDESATYRWANGKTYVGPFKNGYMEGHGRLFMQGGKGEYVGEFSRNLKVGHGKMKTETGEYEGPFENGEMNGNGIFRWYDGKIYEGQFVNGELHGNGTIYYPTNQKATGVWHRGENLQLNSVGPGSFGRN